MDVTYIAQNSNAIQLPDGTIRRPVNGRFVADIAHRDTLESAGIYIDESSTIVRIVSVTSLTTEHNGQTITNGTFNNTCVVPPGLPAGFTCTVVQEYSVPTRFRAGEGVTLNGAMLLTSKQGERLRLEYVSPDVYNVAPE